MNEGRAVRRESGVQRSGGVQCTRGGYAVLQGCARQKESSVQGWGGVQCKRGGQCKRRAACNALRVCNAKWEQRAVLWGRAMHEGGGGNAKGEERAML